MEIELVCEYPESPGQGYFVYDDSDFEEEACVQCD